MSEPERVVLVTGASRGLGRVFVDVLVESGFRVACLSRPSPELDAVGEAHGDRVLLVPADIADSAEVDAAVATVESHWGRLDVLVNNAAVFEPAGIEHGRDEVVRRHVDVNLLGAVWCTRAAIPLLRRSGGHVVCVSSESVRSPFPMLGIYTATKVAVETLASTWRDELRPEGIRVSTLRVGRFFGSTGSARWPAETRERFMEVVARSGHLEFAGGRSDPRSMARALVHLLELPADVNADLVEVRSTLP